MVVKCTAEYVISNPRPRAGRRLAPLYLGWCRCPLSQLSDQSDDTGSVGNLLLPPPPTWLLLWSTCRPPQRRDTHLRETDAQTDVQAVGIGNKKKSIFLMNKSIARDFNEWCSNHGVYDSCILQVLESIWDCYRVILELKEDESMIKKKMRILAAPLGGCTSRLYQD